MNLDAVVELVVDENALVDRMRKRVAETLAAGKPVRADDNPETFKTRLDAYRAQTAPVSKHYAERGELKQSRRHDDHRRRHHGDQQVDRALTSGPVIASGAKQP